MTDTLLLRGVAVPRALWSAPENLGGRPAADCLVGDLLIEAGRVAGWRPPAADAGGARVIDLAGRLLLPRLTEVHCHLDKCHTLSRLGVVGGDLHTAIERQEADKALWTAEDLRERAGRGLRELALAGCGTVRTHVDWEGELLAARQPPLAWFVLGELAEAWAGRLTVQRAALVPVDAFADPATVAPIIREVARGAGGVLGVFVFDQPAKREWLRAAFTQALAHDLALDFHVDEGLGPGLDGLEIIAELALELRFARPILCGHACSLSNLSGPALARVLDKVAAAGLGVTALPTTNLYLQDRQAGSPQRRGLTRLRELAAAGVNVTIGSDNVADAFCPLGVHDPLAALSLAALAAHLDPPYGPWLRTVTTDARRSLGLAPLPIDQAGVDDLLVVEASQTAGAVAGAARRPLREWLPAA